MKINSVDISECRGIRDFQIDPQGDNVVIWGYNGTGKSAVVDAIEFLLTGEIGRLTGPGTQSITLKRHGPHVDADPEDAEVTAEIQLPSGATPEVSRSIDDPTSLEYPDEHAGEIEEVVQNASDKHFLLTREDVLKFVQVSDSERSEQMETLLNLDNVEEVRTSLVSAANEAQSRRSTAESQVETCKSQINRLLGLDTWEDGDVLDEVNKRRSIFGGEPLEVLDSDAILGDLQRPSEGDTEGDEDEDSPPVIEDTASTLLDRLEDPGDLTGAIESLKTLVGEVEEDPELQKEAERKRLYEIGEGLVGDTDECPLCGKEWDPEELEDHVEDCLEDARSGQETLDEIDEIADTLRSYALTTKAALEDFIENSPEESLPDGTEECHREISEVSDFLQDPATHYTDFDGDLSDLPALTRLEHLRPSIEELAEPDEEDATGPEDEDPEEEPLGAGEAWDELTRLQDRLSTLDEMELQRQKAVKTEKRAVALKDRFTEAKDSELDALYELISDRFVELYESIHAPDEDDFEAKIEPSGAGIGMEVDFYGRGEFEPNALHSEGHQDSMGLCLFLALREHLPGDLISLVLLDDIVMSIDSGHRKEVAELLQTEFDDEQFIITTHDKNWARQLKTEGVVGRSDKVDLYNWDVETGPSVTTVGDFMAKVKAEKDQDVNAAVARLRRGAEAFFSDACHRLDARVPYRREGRWTMWDLVPAAGSKLKSLLKQGKVWSQETGQTEIHENLVDRDDKRGDAMSTLQVEKWPVNPATHYTRWEDISPGELEDVIEAFEDLFDVFSCSECGSQLEVLRTDYDEAGVKCSNGCTHWLLDET